MDKILEVFKLIPVIIELIKAIEQAIPGESKGEAKLVAVREILEIDKLLLYKEHHIESDKQEYKEDFSTASGVTEQAKTICIEKLLIPFEGTGPMENGKFLAYKDPASIDGLPITIAWGLTYHADGIPIFIGEVWEYEYAVKVKSLVLDKFIKGFIESGVFSIR